MTAPAGVPSKDDIRQMLLTNDRALARGIVAIYKRQTAHERQAKATVEGNGVGFNASDARPLSRIAQQLLAGGTLLPVDAAIARERMPKYAGQLLEIAIARSFGL